MILKEVLNEKAFVLGIKGNNKQEIIKEIAAFYAGTYNLNEEEVFNALWTREQKSSTGLGKGLAIPHARIKGISNMKLAVFYSKEGKDFASYDSVPTNLFFVALIDEGVHPQEQLEMLKTIVETCEKTDLLSILPDVLSTAKLREIVLQRLSDVQNS